MLCFGTVFLLILGAKAITLPELEQKFNALEKRVLATEQQLEYGGKHFQTIPLSTCYCYISYTVCILFYNWIGRVQLRDHDYIKLQFLGAKNAWLGCSGVCSLQTCSSRGESYRNFQGRCSNEEFQIIGEGNNYYPIKSGHRIRIRYLHKFNSWIGCSSLENRHCHNKATCPGTSAQGKDFLNNKCWGEIFIIYARGKKNGEIIYNGDEVMLYYQRRGLYISIQGENLSSETSLNFCPGAAPPAYLSYSICSKNVFRIYRKP